MNYSAGTGATTASELISCGAKVGVIPLSVSTHVVVTQ